MQGRGGRASPAQLQQLPRESLRGREMGLAVGRFVASSVEDLAPRRELGAGIPDNTTGGGIWKIHSSTWIWAFQGTRHCLLWIVLACRLCQNPAKELPGSSSSAFTSVPRLAWPGARPLHCSQQSLWDVLLRSSLWSCAGAMPRTWDAQCVCPEVLASV